MEFEYPFADLCVCLHSEQKRTQWCKLDNMLRNDLERGQVSIFNVQLEKLDNIEMIELRSRGVFKNFVFVDFVEINEENQLDRLFFPFYRWLQDELSMVSSGQKPIPL